MSKISRLVSPVLVTRHVLIRLSYRYNHGPSKLTKQLHEGHVSKNALSNRNLKIVKIVKNANIQANVEQTNNDKSNNEMNMNLINLLTKQNKGSAIFSILSKNANAITDPSVYGIAMQQCDNNNELKSVPRIMKMACASQNTSIGLSEFNIFFNCMIRADRPDLCFEYYRIMTDKFGLFPNVSNMNYLIKSCKSQSKCELAQMYWNDMTNKYNLQANAQCYNALLSVYSNAHQTTKCDEIFSEYLQTICGNKEVTVCKQIFHSYLNVYTRIGHVQGMQCVLDLMTENNIENGVSVENEKMRCFLETNEPLKSIEIYKKWVYIDGCIPDLKMINLKCIALKRVILFQARMNCSFDEKYYFCVKLENLIEKYCVKYGLQMEYHRNVAIAFLESSIALYHNIDPTHIVHIFNELIGKQWIAYTLTDRYQNNGQIMLDFHLFNQLSVQFVLRYVFAYELNELVSQNIKNDTLQIIVGKGKHAKGKGNNKAILKQFVINEIKSLIPQIECYSDSKNEGILHIPISQIEAYLSSNQINHSKRLLTAPSDDWFFYDYNEDYS